MQYRFMGVHLLLIHCKERWRIIWPTSSGYKATEIALGVFVCRLPFRIDCTFTAMMYLAHFVLILSISVSSIAQKHVGTLFNFVPDVVSSTRSRKCQIEHVTALNKEISDLAASLGRLLVSHRRLYSFKHSDWEERRDVAEDHLSKDIILILTNQPSEGEATVNPLLSRIVIQVLIVKLLFRKIMAEEPQGNTGPLDTGYGRARAPQENRPQTATLPLEEWKNEVVDAFANTCFVAEWAISDKEHLRRQIFDSPIFELGRELRRILSTARKNSNEYLELKIIRPKTLIFDPFLMDEAFIDPKIPARPGVQTTVVGTTAMGLVKVTLPHGTEGLTHQLILKTKVLLMSGLLASQNHQTPAQPNTRHDGRRDATFGHAAGEAPTFQSANPRIRNW
ncbi:unnamed protein product [Cyclocybe aegerita]|uniref:Uncharacterized protein n=1 Tax=Cyclocybe aegerita TaxID=1973307 RepID=A0A8S0XEZ7_CYCAE|nr:unnamed protein product [Cyclocybe aegerita]